MAEAAEYFSKDFEWEELSNSIQNNPSLTHHLLSSSPSPSLSSSSNVSDAWQSFHTRHSTGKFFKERRYLVKEFPELLCDGDSRVLEVGCGNGSTVVPILRLYIGHDGIETEKSIMQLPHEHERWNSDKFPLSVARKTASKSSGNQHITIYACDCSSEALERTKEVIDAFDEASIKQRFHPFVCDFSKNRFPSWLICSSCQIPSRKEPLDVIVDTNVYTETKIDELPSLKPDQCCIGGVDFITLIFTLSAVPFKSMPKAIQECFSVLKPGGLLLFRDYGLYDMTMLRFAPNKRLGFREYMRSDGTRSYFFSLDTTRELFVGAGFIEVELEYCCVKSTNRRKGKTMHRVWVHGKFQKPI